MANVTLPGTGSVVKTDTVSATEYQIVKIDVGGAGASALLGTANPLPITIVTGVADVISTGSLTGTTSVTQTNTAGLSSSNIQVTGTWVGTLQFEGSVDGTNFFAVSAQAPVTGVLVSSATANGSWTTSVTGLQLFRVRCSAFTSGTIVVTIRGVTADTLFGLDAPIPTGSNVIGAVTQSGTWNIGSITTMPTTAVTIATAPVLVAGAALIGKVGLDQTTPGTTNAISIAQIAGTTVVTGGVAGTQGVGGITAAAATSTGNPVRVGAIGRTANPTAVTDGQVSNLMTDKMGRAVVVQGHIRNLVVGQATTITSSTSLTTVVAAGGASVFTDITSFTVTNGSATATIVTLTDGTINYVFNVPGGGGFTIPYNPPLPGTTANTVWSLTCGTSVASVYVSIVFVKNL